MVTNDFTNDYYSIKLNTQYVNLKIKGKII